MLGHAIVKHNKITLQLPKPQGLRGLTTQNFTSQFLYKPLAWQNSSIHTVMQASRLTICAHPGDAPSGTRDLCKSNNIEKENGELFMGFLAVKNAQVTDFILITIQWPELVTWLCLMSWGWKYKGENVIIIDPFFLPES